MRLVAPEPSPERARVLLSLAWHLVITARFAEARALAEEAAAVAAQVGARVQEADARAALGQAHAHAHLGEADAGIAELDTAATWPPRQAMCRHAAGDGEPLRCTAGGRPPRRNGESRARRRPEGPRHRPGPVFRPDPGRPRHRGTGRGRPLGRGQPGLAGWPERPHRARTGGPHAPSPGGPRPGLGDLDAAEAHLRIARRLLPVNYAGQGTGLLSPALPSWGCGAATWSGPGNWLPRPSRWPRRTCGTPRRCMPSACASKPTALSSLVRRPGETAIDDSAAAGLLEAAWQAASGPAAAGLPELAAWHATALAETTRHVGRADPAAWAAAATV